MKEVSLKIDAHHIDLEMITYGTVDIGHEAAAELRITQHRKRSISGERLDVPQHIVHPEHVRWTISLRLRKNN